MSATATTKAVRSVLSTSRTILRHIRMHWSAHNAEGKADVSSFTRYVMAQYRENRSARDKAQVKALRARATDYAAYLAASICQRVRAGAFKALAPPPIVRHLRTPPSRRLSSLRKKARRRTRPPTAQPSRGS
jgi:hypothetical protein